MGRTPKVNARGGGSTGPAWRRCSFTVEDCRWATSSAPQPARRRPGPSDASPSQSLRHDHGTVLDTGTLRAMAGIPPEVQRVIHGADPISQLL
ncbi:MAG: hypothetical protein Ct9H300mP32_0840 [Verrucomicrobiota bacterium]|nr:MAG: hypothetical protein Ct9H300mP32_0840 [Verrucomicrobiota bacterium]